jgi:CheY-like chemotaxis protein
VESYLPRDKSEYDEGDESKVSNYEINYSNNNIDNPASKHPIPPQIEERLTEDVGGDGHSSSEKSSKPLAKLLVVDDESDIVQVLKLGLQKNRFLVNAFTNPEEALQSFKSDAESYCLVLSDVRMPSISGIQLSKKVKEVDPNVKVMLMTSFMIRDSEFSIMFPSAQVDGFVQKPVGIKELTDKILSLVGGTKRRTGDDDGDGDDGNSNDRYRGAEV